MPEWIEVAYDFMTNLYNNDRQDNREHLAREENYKYGELSANEADTRTRNLYNDLYSPQAKMNQIKEAGLSPSLFGDIASAGGSGQAGAQGTGAVGVNPHTFGLNPLNLADMRLKNAEAEKIEEETKTIKGENEYGAKIIEQLASEISNNEAKEKLITAQTENQNIFNYIKEKGKDIEVTKLIAETEKAMKDSEIAVEQLKQSKIESDIKQETKDEIIKNISLQNAQLLTSTLLNKSNVELNDTKKKQIENAIQIEMQKVNIAYYNYLNDTKNTELREQELKQQIYQFEKTYEKILKELELQEDDLMYKYGETLIEKGGIENQYVTSIGTRTTHKKLGEPTKFQKLLNKIFGH